MKTQTIVLSNTPAIRQPIEFTHTLMSDGSMHQGASPGPSKYKVIELIARSYTHNGKDLMFAHDGDRNEGVLFLGYWNDGTVEDE